jgi:hypothetical protein
MDTQNATVDDVIDLEFNFADSLIIYEAYPDQIWSAIAMIGGFVALIQI